MIVGLVGFIGSGKSTVASGLVRDHGFTEIAFADTLKDVCSLTFDWPRDLLQGDTAAARKWRETEDKWWAEKLARPGFSPRQAMQILGTEVMRGGFDDNIWILSVERKIASAPGNIVVTDCRFPNEFKMVRRLGGVIARVKRGPDPAWLPVAKEAMDLSAGKGFERAQAIAELKEKWNIHSSEYSWVNERINHTFVNEFTVDVLDQNITKWLERQEGLYLAETG
jgi:ABC-type oligopeptide transport system ATPase subunit